MLWLPLTAFRMVPISSSLHRAPGKQNDPSKTSSPDRNMRLFLKGVRVLKTDGQKALPKQAGYLWRTS